MKRLAVLALSLVPAAWATKPMLFVYFEEPANMASFSPPA
jgi:hypothetical protein